MPFHTGKYDTYVILGDPCAKRLWSWPVWSKMVSSLDPMVHAARGRAGVRSLQDQPDRKGLVKFGRIGWDEKSHQKWTHESPTNRRDSVTWDFLDVEVWAPIWTICEKEDRAPDVFFRIANEAFGVYDQELSFNPVVLLAFSLTIAERMSTEIESAISMFARLASAKLCAYQRRPWGISCSVGYTDAINDLGISGLFKVGHRHRGNVGLHLLKGKWNLVATPPQRAVKKSH